MRFDTRTIPNFLSDQEIEIIEQTVSQHAAPDRIVEDKSDTHHAQTYNFFVDHPEYESIHNILMPKLRQHFGQNIQVQSSHILNSYCPYGIHTDVMSAGFDPAGTDLAAWTFIIPLADYNSHTIVFEQGHDTIKTVNEWMQTIQPTPNLIDDAFHQRYLTHTDRLDLQWLTPEAVFSWRKGHLFAADRRKFHTSDDFPSHGINCKRAIIIWSTVPRQ